MDRKCLIWIDKYIDKESLENKTILITGGNSGIGFMVARYCLYLKMNVILAVRNLERGNKAKESLENEFEKGKVSLMELDIASFESIDSFIETYKQYNIHVDYFYNNAGVLNINGKTKQDHEIVMGTNYEGTAYLTSKLLDNCLDSRKTRIIFIGSIASYLGKIDYKNFFIESDKKAFKKYANSKLAISQLYSYLSEKRTDKSVDFVLVHPGATYTPLIKKAFGKLISFLANGFMNIFFHKVDKAALVTIYALTDKVKNGDYIGPRGLLHIAGYPTKTKLRRKHKNYKNTIEYTKKSLKISL